MYAFSHLLTLLQQEEFKNEKFAVFLLATFGEGGKVSLSFTIVLGMSQRTLLLHRADRQCAAILGVDHER